MAEEPSYHGKSLTNWFEQLTSSGGLREAEARAAMAKMGASAVALLVTKIDSKDPTISAKAIRALGDCGSGAEIAIPDIISVSNSEHEIVRLSCVVAIGLLKTGGKEAINVLIKGISDKSTVVRSSAIYALGQWGEKAKDAIPSLTKLLSLADSELAAADVLDAISKIGPAASEAVPVLAAILKGPRKTLRARVLSALEKIGPAGSSAIDDVTLFVDDSDAEVSKNARAAVRAMSAPKQLDVDKNK